MKLASIFKIEFTLSNLAHSALVSISGDNEDSFVHVQLINSFFKKVFGVEHIRFHNRNGQIQLGEIKYPFVQQIATVVSSKVDAELKTLIPWIHCRLYNAVDFEAWRRLLVA